MFHEVERYGITVRREGWDSAPPRPLGTRQRETAPHLDHRGPAPPRRRRGRRIRRTATVVLQGVGKLSAHRCHLRRRRRRRTPVYAVHATHGMASYQRALHRCGLECCGKDGEGSHAALTCPSDASERSCSRCWPNECRAVWAPLYGPRRGPASVPAQVNLSAGMQIKRKAAPRRRS